MAVTYLVPVVIMLFQQVFSPLVKKLIRFELWSTKTKYYISAAYKKSFGGFFVQIGILLVINGLIIPNLYGPSGFIYIVEKILLMKRKKKNIQKNLFIFLSK